MRRHSSTQRILAFETVVAVAAIAACAPEATPPPLDVMATAVAQVAFGLLTQTAAAASPTPAVTPTPNSTETPTEVSPTSQDFGRMPMTLSYAACWFGPGSGYDLDSNISKGKGVELLGIGNVPGWYVIRNPYFHSPCWIRATDLRIFDGTDLTKYPVMKPGGP